MFLPIDIPPEAILPKIVEKCGDKKYWESWAKDVADIFQRLVGRIENLLDTPENDALRVWFEDFHTELRDSINAAITRSHAIDMMAQHILTQPVFDALFQDYDFSARNPMAMALEQLRQDFAEFGLENETRDLEGFYESVRLRAQGIDNSAGRQKVLAELYENFFVTAVKKEADRLGIVYTPVEVVDFILHSANAILREEFDLSLNDEGVHVLDPFTGTGTFLARLLQSELIQGSDLKRKYRQELHANEMVLLAYYIAAVNIEEAYRGRRGEDTPYETFKGIVLTDTFNLNKAEDPTLFPKDWLPDNNERAETQQKLPIQVILGNPPWSAGQRSATDDNPNVEYPELEERIRATYFVYTTATNKRGLYDTYKMAIRWATDRIGKQGVIAFVTPASWIDGNVDAGIRACLPEEFTAIYVLNLLGNARIHDSAGRYHQGEGIFGNATQSPVAITILVKNDKREKEGSREKNCRIYYRDIGSNLKREEKLQKLTEAASISGFTDWQTITPDKHHDWIGQRSEAFAQFYPLGTKEAKAGRADNAIFKLFSNGYKTSRDAYIYNFSRAACAENALRMTQDYLAALAELEADPELTAAVVARRHSSKIRWDRELENQLKRRRRTEFDVNYIRKTAYRPFVKTNSYTDYTFANCKYQQDLIFPDGSSENRVICVPGLSSKKSFSALITDTMPDLNINEAGTQCFPRWRYLNQRDPSQTSVELLNTDIDGGG